MGPVALAGFIAAPVNGPPVNTSATTIRPTPNPPIFGERLSTIVPYTARTSKNVITSSNSIPWLTELALDRGGAPLPAAAPNEEGDEASRRTPASVAQTSWLMR